MPRREEPLQPFLRLVPMARRRRVAKLVGVSPEQIVRRSERAGPCVRPHEPGLARIAHLVDVAFADQFSCLIAICSSRLSQSLLYINRDGGI